MRLVFSEPIEPTLGAISVTGADNHTTRLAAHGDPRDVHALIAAIEEPLTPGPYRLAWRIVSADGHPVQGSYVFVVADAATAAGAADSAQTRAPAPPVPVAPRAEVRPTPLLRPTFQAAPIVPAVLRGAGVGALMALGGLLYFLARAPAGAAPRRARRLATWLAVAAPLLLAAHLTGWLAHTSPTQHLDADWAATALGAGIGRVELWRVGLALLVPWALVLTRRVGLALLFAGASLLASGAVGHSAALQPMWAIPAKALHLVAGAAWIGGILWLVSLARDDDPTVPFAREAERVSAVALAAVIAVAISGVVQTALFLASPFDLVRSAYGVTVLAKVAGLGALAAFGAHYRRRVLPALPVDPARRTSFAGLLGRELAVMSAVVLLGGLLAYLAPPGDEGRTPAHAAAHPPSPD